MIWRSLLALLVVLSVPVAAQDSLPPAPYAYRQLDDPALEAKAQALMESLRCLACQSQSIADSDAKIAGDMRHQVRTRILAGEDPALEAKAQALMESLRCLACQSQSIADSDAKIAGDMRHQVRTRIAAGEDPEQVRAWMIERYGDYISYKPVVSVTTWPLFAIPVVLLALVALILRRRLGRAK